MLILKTAFKNIIGGGKKTWLNVFVLSFTMVLMIALIALIDGWLEESRTETINWETGGGQLWHPAYDRYDIFTLQDAHGDIPNAAKKCISEGQATPLLIMQGTIYPDGRMQSVLLKGIDPEQSVIEIPAASLADKSSDYIPAVIGRRMARSADICEGDVVMLRWRDANGVFDAREIIVAGIFDTKATGVDGGQIWVDLGDLYDMTGMHGEATMIIKSGECALNEGSGGWIYHGLDYLLADLDAMAAAAWVEVVIIFALLMALCLLAVYDTQTLSIFRRQKEIGTYIALGMTPRRVIGLFTLEGTTYSLLAVATGLVWGTPLLWLFGKYGFSMPGSFEDMMGTDTLYPVYNFSSIFGSLAIVILLSALISYLPARKIARQNVVYALKGKIQ